MCIWCGDVCSIYMRQHLCVLKESWPHKRVMTRINESWCTCGSDRELSPPRRFSCGSCWTYSAGPGHKNESRNVRRRHGKRESVRKRGRERERKREGENERERQKARESERERERERFTTRREGGLHSKSSFSLFYFILSHLHDSHEGSALRASRRVLCEWIPWDTYVYLHIYIHKNSTTYICI